jgi:tetratricopeptide (TPR) repeat protein
VEAEHFSFADPEWVVVPNEKERQARHKHFRGSGYLLVQQWGKGGSDELAETRRKQEFEVKRRVLGETHPSTLLSMAKLAWAQERYDEAEKLHQQLLDRWKDMDPQRSTFETDLNYLSLNVYQRRAWRGAETYGRQGVERARRFDPDGAQLMFNAAPFLLLSGQHDEYRQICRQLLGKHAQTESAATAAQVVRMCTLDPDFGESERLVSLDQRAAKGGNDYELYALGMAYCRAGDYDKALERLQNAFGCPGPTPGGPAIVALQLAITYHRAGRTEEAKSWLDKAEKLFEPNRKLPTFARIETLIYHQEAKSLIQAPAAKPSPADASP